MAAYAGRWQSACDQEELQPPAASQRGARLSGGWRSERVRDGKASGEDAKAHEARMVAAGAEKLSVSCCGGSSLSREEGVEREFGRRGTPAAAEQP